MSKGSNISAAPRKMGPASTAEAGTVYALQLYVVGASPRSVRAISNIRNICERHLSGRYNLEVIDISDHPERAKEQQLLAAPTLIKTWPLPVRRFVGDMSLSEPIVLGFDLRDSPQAAVT